MGTSRRSAAAGIAIDTTIIRLAAGYPNVVDPTVLDTDIDAYERQRDVWRRLGPSGRLEQAIRMSEEARELSIAGLMARQPDLSRREALLAVVRQQLGDDVFREAFGR